MRKFWRRRWLLGNVNAVHSTDSIVCLKMVTMASFMHTH